MKRDITPKIRAPFQADNAYVKRHLLELLTLIDELRVAYETYPKLQAMVSVDAWNQLTDLPYRQLLELNLAPRDRKLRDAVARNMLRLEDLSASTLIRDRSGFNDTLTRVLRYRIVNGMVGT